MRVKQIVFSRTVNLGNYHSEKLEVVVGLDEGDDPAIVVSAAKKFVYGELSIATDIDWSGVPDLISDGGDNVGTERGVEGRV